MLKELRKYQEKGFASDRPGHVLPSRHASSSSVLCTGSEDLHRQQSESQVGPASLSNKPHTLHRSIELKSTLAARDDQAIMDASNCLIRIPE